MIRKTVKRFARDSRQGLHDVRETIERTTWWFLFLPIFVSDEMISIVRL